MPFFDRPSVFSPRQFPLFTCHAEDRRNLMGSRYSHPSSRGVAFSLCLVCCTEVCALFQMHLCVCAVVLGPFQPSVYPPTACISSLSSSSQHSRLTSGVTHGCACAGVCAVDNAETHLSSVFTLSAQKGKSNPP